MAAANAAMFALPLPDSSKAFNSASVNPAALAAVSTETFAAAALPNNIAQMIFQIHMAIS